MFLAVGLVTFAVYIPSLLNGFVRWDDDANFLDNENYRGLGAANLRWMFTHFHLGHYHPLTWITLGVDYLIWGMNPLGYHLTNVVLHSVSAVLFARLAGWFFATRRSTAAGVTDQGSAALWFGTFVTLAWSLHPLRVEAVTWITQRREVLCGVLTLLAITSYARSRQWWLTAALTLLAMLAKVTAVTIPALLVLIDVYRAGGIGAPGWTTAALKSCLRNVHLVAMALAAVGVAFIAQREATALVSSAALPITGRLALYFFGIMFCLAKTFWPSGLAPLHQGQLSTTTWELAPFVWWTALAGFVLTAIVVAIGWRKRRTVPGILCLVGAFLILVAPAGGLGQSGPQIAAERYTYQPGWALTLGIGAIIAAVTTWPAFWWRRWSSMLATGLVLAALIGRTIKQQRFWFDSESLWLREAEIYPANPMGNYNLGLLNFRRKPPDLAAAERYYRTAITSDPEYLDARAGLGFTLRAAGRTPEALDVLEEIRRTKPERMQPNVLALEGSLLWDLGRKDEAVAAFTQLLARDSRNPDAYKQLAKIQAAVGRPNEAIATLERGILTAPDAALYGELAWILATHPDAKIRNGRRALDLAEKVAPRERRGLRTVTLYAAAAAEAGEFDAGVAEVKAAIARLPEHEAALRKLLLDLERHQTVRAEPRYP